MVIVKISNMFVKMEVNIGVRENLARHLIMYSGEILKR